MQNRFTLTGVPRAARRRAEEVRELVEDEVCWVDRMAVLEDGALALELNLENMRDVAIAALDGRELSLPAIERDLPLTFHVHAAPATPAQSAELLEKAPSNGKTPGDPPVPETSVGPETPEGGPEERRPQTVRLCAGPRAVSLHVQHPIGREGGTGAHLWSGGVMLAQHICHWPL